MRILFLRKQTEEGVEVAGRKWTFTLIGSRARGEAREDSDWDVLATPHPMIRIDAPTWGEASFELLKILDWWDGVDRLIAEAVKYLKREHGYKPGEPIDVFVEFDWNGRWQAAQITYWDDWHECWGGWLTEDPRAEGFLDPRKRPQQEKEDSPLQGEGEKMRVILRKDKDLTRLSLFSCLEYLERVLSEVKGELNGALKTLRASASKGQFVEGSPEVDTQVRLAITNAIHDLESAIETIKNYRRLGDGS